MLNRSSPAYILCWGGDKTYLIPGKKREKETPTTPYDINTHLVCQQSRIITRANLPWLTDLLTWEYFRVTIYPRSKIDDACISVSSSLSGGVKKKKKGGNRESLSVFPGSLSSDAGFIFLGCLLESSQSVKRTPLKEKKKSVKREVTAKWVWKIG